MYRQDFTVIDKMKAIEEIPEILILGMSHKTAPVEIREVFSFEDSVVSSLMEDAKSNGIDEIAYVSTCNRVELYFTATDIPDTIDTIIGLLENHSGMHREKFKDYIYKMYSRDAVHHLLTVASSLDSMVIGENEILGQVKKAYNKSVKEKKTGTLLNRLFHQAFNTSKRVRTETEISQNPLSIAYIATELAKKIFEDLSTRNALLLGAGEMGELILKYFTKSNINEITIANRSLRNAERIANEINRNAHIIPLDDVMNAAVQVDILISSVSTQKYVLTKAHAEEIIEKKGNRRLFIIDIAVPRNIDPEVADLDNVFVYNIDDLKAIADENLKNRLNEVDLAEKLIESDVNEFFDWYEGLAIVPSIVRIQDKFDEIRKNELKKYRRKKMKHIKENDFILIEELTRQIMTKTLHNPITTLKQYQAVNGKEDKNESARDIARIIEELFVK